MKEKRRWRDAEAERGERKGERDERVEGRRVKKKNSNKKKKGKKERNEE